MRMVSDGGTLALVLMIFQVLLPRRVNYDSTNI
jgi:hypothetical protein